MLKILLATTLAALAPAAAPRVVDVAPFKAIELVGGGELILRNGPVQRVTVAADPAAPPRLTVDADGDLKIEPCPGGCSGPAPRFEVTTSGLLTAIAVNQGGSIRADGTWPLQRKVAVAVGRGGSIDLRNVPVDEVAAAVSNGGSISVAPRRSLAAAVNQGGRIGYLGNPKVSQIVTNGGLVAPIRD